MNYLLIIFLEIKEYQESVGEFLLQQLSVLSMLLFFSAHFHQNLVELSSFGAGLGLPKSKAVMGELQQHK